MPHPLKYDQHPEFEKHAMHLYKNVNPAKKETQQRLTTYSPKPYGTKKTYSQNWPIYEKAMSQEKLMVFRIIKDAVDQFDLDTPYKGNGRPSVLEDDIIKALCIKAYSNYSSWRSESELMIARSMGIIQDVPKRSTLNKYMKDPRLTSLLHKLYQAIAEPLAEIDIYVAVDASGISKAYGNRRWRTIRHTKEEQKTVRDYRKLHIMSGVKTNVICAARITNSTGVGTHDVTQFKSLLDETCKIFTPKEVFADKGYFSKDIVKYIVKKGAAPFIPIKKNTHIPKRGIPTAWSSMLQLCKNHQMYFAEHYHKRSNVEATFSAFKRKYGDFCRCKDPISQENEILCKIVCFNAAILAEALLTYDLKTGFMASL